MENGKRTLLGLLLILLTTMPEAVLAAGTHDTPILDRIYEYRRQHPFKGTFDDQVYTKFRFETNRRNPTLWLIPTTYVLAKGERYYIAEYYSNMRYMRRIDYEIGSQVRTGTIRKNHKVMPTLFDFVTPHIYDIDIYNGHILSPFHKVNRHYYRYTQREVDAETTRLDFVPKLYNTQLVNGYAFVETATGRILRTMINGEFDMISFRTEIEQDTLGGHPTLPLHSSTATTFRFLGNRISSVFETTNRCPVVLPDSIGQVPSRPMMDSLRPLPLTETDKMIYQLHDEKLQKPQTDTLQADTTPAPRKQSFGRMLWNFGDNLVTPIAAESQQAYFKMSPIINPLYVSYSHSRGWRYKMRLRAGYSFNAHRYLTLNPTLGYNFMLRQFYFTLPLRMTYNPKRNGYVEVVYGNGNRISNASVMDVINHDHLDTLNFENTNIDKFNDNHLQVFNNIMVFPWLDIETGIVAHQRKAVDKRLMHQYNMPNEYRSFATKFGVKLLPWERGPVLSIDWERAFKDINGSDLDYQRWESDLQWKIRIPGLRLLNLRLGGGFYDRKKQNYFVDFDNFRDKNLPEGWDDGWSGNFQLLSSRMYNKSDNYLRANLSYESPMLVATWVPYLGKYIEKERFYVSAVKLDHTRPYTELGYGFTNRYISIGLFASFLGFDYQRAGIEFEFELFRRW